MLDGDPSAARAAYETALALLPADPPTKARATALHRTAIICFALHEYELAHRYAEEAVTIAQLLGDLALEGRASAALAPRLSLREDEQAGMNMARRALTLSTASGDIEAIIDAYCAFTDVASVWGRVPDMLASAQHGLAAATRLGVTYSQIASELAGKTAHALFQSGDWSGAERLWGRLLADPHDEITAFVVPILVARLRVAQGRFADAAALLRPDEGPGPGTLASVGHELIRAESAIWQGLLEDARAAIARAADPLGDDLYPTITGDIIGAAERIVADTVLSARDSGKGATSAEAPDVLLGSLLVRQPRHPEHSAPRIRAWLRTADAERTRRDTSDPAAWIAAVEAWDDFGHSWHAAYARFRLAEALVGRPSDRPRAGEPLRMAFQFARTVGALPLLADIEALAKRARISLEARPAPPPQPADPHGLTDREIDVVRLLADGATNARIAKTLFISETTAATHVSNILRKLGASRRTEAAAIAHRLGVTQPPPR